MTEYVVPPSNIVYTNGASGSADHVAGTYTGFGRSSFDWSGSFAGLNIGGFKVVFEASAGDGYLFWDISIDNPGWPSSPTWSADDASHIGLNNSYDGLGSAIRVDGPTQYEWEFYWPGDPTFGGFTFNDPVGDLLTSLAAAGNVYGNLEVGGGPVASPIVVTRFDLVLLPPKLSPCFQTLTVSEWALGNGHNSTLTGDAETVWSDDSDATFVTFADSGDSYGALTPYGRLSGLDVTVNVRAASVSGDSFYVDLWNGFDGTTATNFLISVPITVASGGGIADYSRTVSPGDLADWSTDLPTVIAGLSSDSLAAWVNGVGDVVIYELSVRVGHKCVVAPPPLRRFPRADGLGIGPRRHYPPPESRRRVGGYY